MTTSKPFAVDDLVRILRAGAGESDQMPVEGDILDVRFDDLGYDSLALLETGVLIGQEYGDVLDDDAIAAVETPRQLIAAVNERLTADAGA